MARRFQDSVGYYATADITKKWTGLSPVVTPVVAAAPAGRGTGNALKNEPQIYDAGAFITLDGQATWTVGFALFTDKFSTETQGRLVMLNDGFTELCGIKVNGNGTISAIHPDYANVIGTSTFPISEGVWFYIEAQFVLHGSAGSITVRVDGTERLSVTGVNTLQTGSTTADTITCYAPGQAVGGSASYIRDIWINDTQETDWQGLPTTHTGFDGDRRIRVLLPEAPSGAYSEFTGSDEDSTDNYALVDENPTDTADYVTSSTVGHRDSYNFQNVPDEAGSVGPLQLVLIAQKDYTDPRKIRGTTRISATDYEADAEFGVSGSSHTLGTSWNGYRQIWEVQPVAGNAAWDKATVDAAEFGAKLAV